MTAIGGTVWAGRAAMRVSVSGWRTTEADIELSTDTILRCLAEVDGAEQDVPPPAGPVCCNGAPPTGVVAPSVRPRFDEVRAVAVSLPEVIHGHHHRSRFDDQ